MAFEWTQLSPAMSPPARSDHSMAYDPDRNVVVLWGGADETDFFTDTWEWDGVTWEEVTTAHAPSGVNGGGPMYWDPNSGTILLVVKPASHSAPIQTWSYDGVDWTQLSPSTVPLNGYFGSMAYYPLIDRIVLIGYDMAGTTFGDHTVLWDGSDWTNSTPANHPDVVTQCQVVYDRIADRILKLLGRNGLLLYSDEVWAYDGSDWTNVSPVGTTPDAKSSFPGCYIPSCDASVIFSGDLPTPNTDTWSLSGGVGGWTLEAPASSPAARVIFTGSPGMCLNVGETTAVMFGGQEGAGSAVLDDTWIASCGTIGDNAAINHAFGLGV